MAQAALFVDSDALPTRGRPRLLRAVLLSLGFLAVGASLLVVLFNPEQAADVAPIGVLFGGTMAGVVFILGARAHQDRERVAWIMIGSGMVLASAGVLTVGLLDLVTGSVAAFGAHDLIFIFAYGMVLVGFWLMPHLGSAVSSRVRVMLDGLIGALTMATVIAIFYREGLVAHLATTATGWERFAGVAYPLLDSAMVVAAMIVTVRRSTWRFDNRVFLIGIGMCLQAFGDLGLVSSGIGENFSNANPNFTVFLIAMACYMGSAALVERSPKPREYADRRQPLWAILAPYGAAGLAVGLVAWELRHADLEVDHLLLLAIGLAVISLVITRQLVALRDYRNLVEDRRRALVASVSHELRTPLTAMVGFLDVMKDPNMVMADEERRELTGVVHQQAIYMSRIVSDLLLLARDSAGPDLYESVVSVDKVVADSVWSGRASPAGLEVEVRPGMFAYLDPDRIRQVLDNLVTNGMRYGGGQVLVSVAARDTDLIFEVHDDGLGVPRKFEVVIWDQFERGPNRLNSNVPGSGIGLAVVDRIVRRHNGTTGYERSRRLGGACFRVVLPGRLRPAPRQRQNEGLQASVPAR